MVLNASSPAPVVVLARRCPRRGPSRTQGCPAPRGTAERTFLVPIIAGTAARRAGDDASSADLRPDIEQQFPKGDALARNTRTGMR
ncbi:MAG TPA: hypothetical protein VLH10_21395 [Yinghuangia sp.]|nr:hypothetical protein [Yinghuangia sp.]